MSISTRMCVQSLEPLCVEVKELTKCMRAILTATIQLRECGNDVDQLVDVQYSLAASYARTSPLLRQSWLNTMCKTHKDHSFLVEVCIVSFSFTYRFF